VEKYSGLRLQYRETTFPGYQTPADHAADLTATVARLRNPDQLRRSPVAHTAPQGVSTAKALTAAG